MMLFQFALMAAEAMIISLLLLLLYALRPYIGIAGLYVSVGAFQYMQVLLALSIYVEIMPGISVSPGSTILFSGSLFAVLLIYIEEDAVGARNLIYGIVLANISLSALAFLFGFHVNSDLTENYYNLPKELFSQSARVWIVGTLVLILDTFLIIIAYEALSRYFRTSLFFRIFLSLALVLMFDSIFFITGSFYEKPEYTAILLSSIAGKVTMSLFYSAVLAIYLHFLPHTSIMNSATPIKDVFGFLTYRQKYEKLRESSITDPLTGVYNRGFFERSLPIIVSKASADNQCLGLIFIDLDHFKAINDEYGHQEGDRVLSTTGDILRDSLRSQDLPFRYGGEEFIVILPDTDKAGCLILAERIRERIREQITPSRAGRSKFSVTATLGLAMFPIEATNAAGLVELADMRLYSGKQGGRDRTVAD